MTTLEPTPGEGSEDITKETFSSPVGNDRAEMTQAERAAQIADDLEDDRREQARIDQLGPYESDIVDAEDLAPTQEDAASTPKKIPGLITKEEREAMDPVELARRAAEEHEDDKNYWQ